MSKSIYRANAKLTPAQVREIRSQAAAGMPTRALARAFHVGSETIRRAVRGDTWGDVEQVGLPPAVLAQQAAESEARFRERLQLEGLLPVDEALARMQEDVAAATRPARLLAEVQNLIDTRSPGVVDSRDGGIPPPTDGGKNK